MSGFEDPELERLLGRAGGAYPDVNLAYERFQGRVRRARRRRAAVVGSATCGLLIAFTVVALNRATDSPEVQPSGRDTLDGSVPDDSSSDTTSNTTDDSTDTTIDDTTIDDTTIDDTTDSSDPSSSTPTTAESAPVTRTFTGDGGSITVRLQGNTLTLVSYVATAGFSAEVHDSSGDRVEVRFESSSHETRIRVDLENGAMDPSIEEDAK